MSMWFWKFSKSEVVLKNTYITRKAQSVTHFSPLDATPGKVSDEASFRISILMCLAVRPKQLILHTKLTWKISQSYTIIVLGMVLQDRQKKFRNMIISACVYVQMYDKY